MISVLLGILAIFLIMLAKFYLRTPLNELKRLAAQGDEKSKLLYEVARHRKIPGLYLNLGALICFAVAAVFLSRRYSTFTSVAVIVTFVLFTLYIQSHTRLLAGPAMFLAPYLAKLIIFTRPYLVFVVKPFQRFVKHSEFTNLYETDDLVELLHRQAKSGGNRISHDKLKMAENALTFDDKKIKDYMTPRKVVFFVNADDQVGPVLINELHGSGFSRFPVYQGSTDNTVGTLYLRDLIEKRQGGKVSTAMSDDVMYIGDEDTLAHALSRFLKTRHHLFVVKNNFNEVVGVITIEDAIEQLIGRQIVDETDQHKDMRQFAQSAK